MDAQPVTCIFNPFADIIKSIAFYLNPESLRRLPLVCSDFYLSLEDWKFWKKMLEIETKFVIYNSACCGWKRAYNLYVTGGIKALICDNDINVALISMSMEYFLYQKYQNKAFYNACESENLELVIMMLKKFKLYSTLNKSLNSSSANGRNTIVQLLLKDIRIKPENCANAAIINASINGHISTVKLLLVCPEVNIGDQSNLAIRKAALNGCVEMVKLLLSQKQVDPSDVKNSAIKLAYKNRNKNGCILVIKLLLNDTRVISKLNDKQIEKYKACQDI